MTPVDPFTAGGKPPPPRDRGLLLGPANADNFRVKVGRYGDRWYTDQLPADGVADASEWVGPSVSTVKKASGSDWSFVALKRVNVALTERPDRLTRMGPDERYEALKAINKLGLASAAKRGTAVHVLAEDRLYGRSATLTGDAGDEYAESVAAFFQMYSPELVAAEAVAIHRTLNGVGYGGTFDAILQIASLEGEVKTFVVDWKSRGEDSDHGAYPEEAAQVAAYGRADYMIVEGDNGPERRPIPQLDGGLIVSIKPDGCRVYPIDLDAGFAHWTALHAWWVARRDERNSIGRSWAPRKIVAGPVAPRENGTVRHTPDPATPVAAGDAAPSSSPAASPSPLALAKQSLNTNPDQGDDMTDPVLYGETWAALQRHYSELDTAAKAWIGELISQANRKGVPFHARQIKSARVYELYRGLISLCAGGGEGDELLRALLELVIGDVALFPGVDPGHALGSLTAAEATAFANYVDVFNHPGMAAYIDDDGVFRLKILAA